MMGNKIWRLHKAYYGMSKGETNSGDRKGSRQKNDAKENKGTKRASSL